jgi:hypothetical protein
MEATESNCLVVLAAYALSLTLGIGLGLPYLIWLASHRLVAPLPSWLLWLLAAASVAAILRMGVAVRGRVRVLHAMPLALLLAGPLIAWQVRAASGWDEASAAVQVVGAAIFLFLFALVVLGFLALGPPSVEASRRLTRGSIT